MWLSTEPFIARSLPCLAVENRRTRAIVETVRNSATTGPMVKVARAWQHSRRWMATLLAVFMALGGCAAQRPVVADDARARHAGQETVQQDIDECIALAKRGAPASGSGGAAAGRTATGVAVGAGTGAAVGGAGGAAAGAVYGNAGRGAATGAAGGAAAGATAGLIRGLFAWSRTRDPQPANANAVERCLRNRGYEPVGWE